MSCSVVFAKPCLSGKLQNIFDDIKRGCDVVAGVAPCASEKVSKVILCDRCTVFAGFSVFRTLLAFLVAGAALCKRELHLCTCEHSGSWAASRFFL